MSATDKLAGLNLDAHVAEMMWPKFSTYKAGFAQHQAHMKRDKKPLGINPDLNHLPPGLTPSDLADIFKPHERKLMPIETMPEETFIPAISTWPDGRPLTHVFGVGKDSEGYFITDADNVRRPVKVTWDGHFASAELVVPPNSEYAKQPSEPDELVVELRRIADALEVMTRNAARGTAVMPEDVGRTASEVAPTIPLENAQ